MRLPVKLGVLDPVDERDAVMVLVRVFDAEEPGVAERVSVGERERVAVSVGERVAPGRERLAVTVSVGETVGPTRERVAVSVGEIEAVWEREGESVEETEIAARDLVAVSVADPDTVTACERDEVALPIPPALDADAGIGVPCDHPDVTAKAKKKSLRIIFTCIILTIRNFLLLTAR